MNTLIITILNFSILSFAYADYSEPNEVIFSNYFDAHINSFDCTYNSDGKPVFTLEFKKGPLNFLDKYKNFTNNATPGNLCYDLKAFHHYFESHETVKVWLQASRGNSYRAENTSCFEYRYEYIYLNVLDGEPRGLKTKSISVYAHSIISKKEVEVTHCEPADDSY